MKWPVSLPRESIDAFAYFGSWPHWPVPGSDEGALLARMDRLAIRTTVTMPLAGIYSDAKVGNAEVAGLAKRHPDRFAGLATYDPRQSSAPAEVLGRAREAGLRGLALFPAQHAYTLGKEPLIEEALWLAEEWRWPIIVPIRLVLCWWLPSIPIDTIIEVARRHTQLRFIVGSCSYNELDAVLRAMGELRNLYLETSGAQSLDATTEMLERSDASHVLFGSGQPIQMPECNLVKLANDRIDARAKAAILRDNAAQLFGL